MKEQFKNSTTMILFLISCASLFGQKLVATKMETMSGEKYGFVLDVTNEIKIKPRFDEAGYFEQGYAPVRISKLFGIIDSLGNEAVPIKYESITNFHEGLTTASLNGKYGFLNKKGAITIPFIYEDVSQFDNGFANVQKNSKLALMNKQGVVITPFKYIRIENMIGGIAKVCTQNNSDKIQFSDFWGFINDKGQEITKMEFYGDKTYNLENGFALTCLNPINGPSIYNHSLIDKTGKVLIPASQGLYVELAYPKYLLVKRPSGFDFKFGFVDYTGKVLLPVNFTSISQFKFGTQDAPLAQVFFNERRFFYINNDLKCVEFEGMKCPEE